VSKTRVVSLIVTVAGGIALVVGGLDPLEGAPLILAGAVLILIATFLDRAERPLILWRVWAVVLIVLGVAALWHISCQGGFGGSTGRSMWWSLLFLPYFAGWSMIIWGVGAPRWLSGLGIAVGAWYLTLAGSILVHAQARPQTLQHAGDNVIPYVLVLLGLVTVVGCIYRLLHQPASQAPNAETIADETGAGAPE
jgi:hypothetical protein